MKAQGLPTERSFLKEVLKPRQVKFKYSTSSGSVEVEQELPDLKEFEYTLWGDWGPMYTLHLDGHAVFQLNYRHPDQEKTMTHLLRPNSVKVETPMLAEKRASTPLRLTFADHKTDLTYQLYFDRSGEVRFVKGLKSSSGLKLFESEVI